MKPKSEQVEPGYSYLLLLSYDGSNYYGWQKQKDFSPTVQDTLTDALQVLTDGQPVKTLGSSRTDRGVHALEQYCKISIASNFPPAKLEKALRRLLPKDILLLSVQSVLPSFKLMQAVESKIYQYLFLPNQYRVSPMANPWIYPVGNPLDLKLMQQAAKLFLGEHDFINYRVVGTETKTTVRTIYQSYLEEISLIAMPQPWVPEGTLRYVVEGNGFLKQMVRLMVGAIIAAGEQKISLEELERSLKTKHSSRLAPPVPAHGLTLIKTKLRDSL